MKTLSHACIVVSIVILILGLISKYVTPIAALQPASYLLASQILLLFSANFILLEILKK